MGLMAQDQVQIQQMSNDDLLRELQSQLSVSFRDISVLKEALTHSSSDKAENYERLEFLGDRVLSLAIASFLLSQFPDEPEGNLAKRHSGLVQGSTLAEIAREINLGQYLILSDAEEASGGKENDNILADVLEALLGAYYLDQGFDLASELIKNLWGDRVQNDIDVPVEPKTDLQEWTQARGYGLPAYAIVSRTGPDHAPEFKVSVEIHGRKPVIASGASKRQAEKNAASRMLDILLKEAKNKDG